MWERHALRVSLTYFVSRRIFLLTIAAECIAEYIKRPLMTLSCSDIGTDPNVVEDNLIRNFKTARSWDAVLLIDEADVFMERRSTSDLQRNSLVAGISP